MNNRGEGEMDENEAAFLSSSSPTFTAPLFLFFPGWHFFPFSFFSLLFLLFFFLNLGTKKDFINNLTDFFSGALLTWGHVVCHRQRYVCV